MSDIRDAEGAERLAEEAPEEFLRRREFLQRTAMAAGLAATMGTMLPSDTLVAEAARRQRRVRLPSPRNMPVDTFVVLMMENRSFDHYLGWLPNADGRQAGLSYTDRNGQVHETRRLAPDWQGCGHPDPDHSRRGGVEQLNNGACDGFLRSGENDEFAISYYQEGDLGFIQDAAKAFTAYDRFFCSLMASTLPNREYMWAAQSYGLFSNDLPPETQDYKSGFPWETTLFAALERKGVSCRYFYNDVPVSALWGEEGLQRSAPVAEYYQRCADGTLPSVTYIDPNFGGSVGEGPGLSADEHPHGDVRAGQAFMADVVHAFMESPQWERGALFITYDEWGGFFDHVAPPRVPDMRNTRDINTDFGLMGFRLPVVGVSPYLRRGNVAHDTYGFESIIKMIRYRFGIDPLNRRDAYGRNIARSFDWRSNPRLELPTLPDPPTIVSQPCPGNPDGELLRPAEHDLYGLYTSGYLDSLGFDFKHSSPDSTFREPSRMVQSFRPAGS